MAIPKQTQKLVSAGVGQPLNLSPPPSLNFLGLAASAMLKLVQIQGGTKAYSQLLNSFRYTRILLVLLLLSSLWAREEEVSYDNGKGAILRGTLTLPEEGESPFPVALLVAGKGPHTRDVIVFGHKPFQVIADYLAQRGIAVLRVDKRGCGQSTGNYKMATTADFADDVRAGLAYLKTRPEICSRRIGLIGHSEGGLIASMVAVEDLDVAFTILMATPAVPAEELLAAQIENHLRLFGYREEEIEVHQKLKEGLFAIVQEEQDMMAAANRLRNFVRAHPEGGPLLAFWAREANTPWFRSFLTLDPQLVLRQLRTPTLAIGGALDQQVVSEQNLPAIARALEEAGNRDYTIALLPQLNHLFQACETGLPSDIAETPAPIALHTVSEWLLQRL